MSEALFSVENLRVAYPRRSGEVESWAIDGVSFIIKPGERMGLV